MQGKTDTNTHPLSPFTIKRYDPGRELVKVRVLLFEILLLGLAGEECELLFGLAVRELNDLSLVVELVNELIESV